MILSYRYRLLPTKRQHRALETILESQRQLYNAALEERIGAYRKAGLHRNFFDQTKGLTEWRQSDSDGAALPVNLQRATLKRLDRAYRSFFKRVKSGAKPGFPRFRGKGRFQSFGFAEFEGITLKNRTLRFKGMPGGLRVHLHRMLPTDGLITSCTFRRNTKGWTILFSARTQEAPPRGGDRVVGLDLGLTAFATLSDGRQIPSLRAARRSEGRVRRAQRALSRKVRGSRSRQKAKQDVIRCHASIARRRANHLHQASARVIRDFDVVAVEKLNILGLSRGILAKPVRDAGWSLFISMLRYKAERAGARLVEVDPQGTTQDCSGCGARVEKSLKERQHHCDRCGLSINRDLNAALNVLNRAGVGPSLRNVVDVMASVQVEASA